MLPRWNDLWQDGYVKVVRWSYFVVRVLDRRPFLVNNDGVCV